MRKFIIFFTLICSSIFIEAQNNLVFNQVLEFRLVPGASAIVPEGKVWKVENSADGILRVTKADVAYGVGLNNSLFNQPGLSNAVWFSEGTVLGITSGTGVNLSILEFNVVPISETSSGSGGGLSSEGLEFNQVINYAINATLSNTYGQVVDNIVIPEGKVWKITSVALLEGTSNTYPYRLADVSGAGVLLGDIMIFYRPSTNGYSTSSYDNFPIWINSGTKDLAIGKKAASSGTYSYRLTISAIEYNIP